MSEPVLPVLSIVQQQARAAELEGALLVKLHERVSPRDVRLMVACWETRVDLEHLDGLGPHQVLWLAHFKLIETHVDDDDVIWVETTQLGRDLVRYIKEGKS